MAVSTSSSLATAVGHAVSFLTRPLAVSYSAAVVGKLQLVLEGNLTAHYAPTWSTQDPSFGSSRRCLTLSPDCLPPRVIYQACLASGVQWFDWIALLGGIEFDFSVDPGRVSLCVGPMGGAGRITTVWSGDVAAPAPIRAFQSPSRSSKTPAQLLLDETDDEEIFTMIADQIQAPRWMTGSYVPSNRSTSPLSAISSDSRPSSRSSSSSGTFSTASYESGSSPRRERKVFIDTSKNQVTPYDGGKTTVLTGGVMLGGGPKKTSRPAPPQWQSSHV